MKGTHWKRRFSWIDVSFTIGIIVLMSAASYLIFISTKHEAATLPDQKDEPVNGSPIVVETIDSNYPGIKINTETSNDLKAPFAIQYPQSIHHDFNKAIFSYIDNTRKTYLATMSEKNRVESNRKGELNISFETLQHHSGNYSFILVNSSNTGDAHGSMEVRSFHLNPNTGQSITISDVLDHKLNHLKTLSEVVRKAINQDSSLEGRIFPNRVLAKTEPSWDNFSNFAITDDSLIFYYDENDFTSGSVGAPIIGIPLADVNGLLAHEFALVPVKQETETPRDEEAITEDTQVPTEKPVEKLDTNTPSDTTTKQVALTFDDGPDPKSTMKIVEVLKKYNAKATFFMLGSRVEYYPEIAKSIQESGHELGNHTWNHHDLTKMSPENIANEINRTSLMIESVTGQKPTVFRPPYGAVNQTVRDQTRLPIILWDVDTLDWKHRDANNLLQRVKATSKDGSIILMHDIHQSTADGLDAVLAYLHDEGYSFVTVSELDPTTP